MAKADHFYGATDMGRQRSNNEDEFIAKPLDNGKVLACVIDGVGGYEGGEVAAAIAKQTILDHFKEPAADLLLKMKSCFVEANQKIYEDRLNNQNRDSMACVLTLSVADLEQNQIHYAHVGDTRLYLYRDHSLVKLTHDHSFVGFLEDNKRISEEEAMSHPNRNEINKALGYDPNMAGVADYIETGSSPFLPGDLLMLCSDGLTDLIDQKGMIAILDAKATLADKTKMLINAANDAGGKDNITVVLVLNNNKAARQKATKPVLVKKNEQPSKEAETLKPAATPMPSRKRSSGLTWFLFLMVLILAAAVYLLWKENQKKEVTPVPVTQIKQRNAAEKRLLDSLEVSAFLYLDSGYGKTILVSDTVNIQQDSIYINGNGITLQADSNYQGTLFQAAPNCNYILLENMVIEGFDIGLSAQSHILKLKNVRFINCRIPVQYNLSLPLNRTLSGSLVDTVLFRPDSISKNNR
ncbi:MAG: PP2C family protein-serine/threonine phosphatase [Flavisolibacter sp.]